MKTDMTDYYREKNGRIDVKLHLKGWKDNESGFFFLYSPSLDLTGYGETQELAKKSLEITLLEFLEYTKIKNTFFDELENLGWMVNRRKRRVQGPTLEDLLEENETLKELSHKRGVYDVNEQLDLQIA